MPSLSEAEPAITAISEVYWQPSPSTRTDIARSIDMLLFPLVTLLLRRELAVGRALFSMPVISTRLPEYSAGLVNPVS